MIAACVPALNEVNTIGNLVEGLAARGTQVYVMDDGSTDGTGDVARGHGAKVYRHDKPQGIGPSLQDLWRYALGDCAEKVLTIDAGGSHDPAQAGRLLEVDAGVVVGSRFVEGGEHDGNRAGLSKLATKMCNCLGYDLTDWTSGYRAYRSSALRFLICQDFMAKMHGFQIEALWRAMELGYAVKEVPISYVGGRSSFSRGVAVEAFLVWIRMLCRLR